MKTTSNTQAKPAKKLMLSKETIRQITTTEAVTNRGFTLNCTYTC